MVASMSTTTASQQSQQDSNSSIQQDQEQLYYAQLFAVQQQQQAAAAAAAAASASPSNSSNKSGGGTGEGDKNGEVANGRKESDRERKEREWSERNTNLIVNYVPQNMTQEEVRALFGSMGEVESCKLIRDKLTGQSLGYAFVNFERPEDAQKALISMNGLRIQNKTLKVSLARPSKDDIKGANLYVSGLPKSLTQPELEAAFRSFGSIITSRILYDNVTGLSKGVGFVRFDRKSEAEDAIEKMTGTMPWGGDEPVAVKFANSPSTNSTKSSSTSAIQMAQSLIPLQMLQSATPTANQLSLPSLLPTLPGHHQSSVAGGPIHGHTPQHRFRYSPLAGAPLISASAPVAIASTAPTLTSLSAVNPLASATAQTAAVVSQDYLALLQQQLLQQQLTAVGAYAANPLAAAAVAANSQQQQQQNFATQMAAQQQYAAYAAALGLTSSAGSALPLATIGPQQSVNGIQMGQSKSPPGTGWTLSIANLAADTDDSTLWKLFGPFGAVLSAKAMKGKGIGLVTMANYEEAVTAIAGLNGQQLGGRTLQVGLGAQSTNAAAAAIGGGAGALPSLIR